jgi:hypothetical protein
MIVEAKTFEFGKLKGSIYDFPNVEDVLPKHSHVESTAHITIVAKGKIRVTAGNWLEIPAGRGTLAPCHCLLSELWSRSQVGS